MESPWIAKEVVQYRRSREPYHLYSFMLSHKASLPHVSKMCHKKSISALLYVYNIMIRLTDQYHIIVQNMNNDLQLHYVKIIVL